ncbi:MAG: 50S ribosomal protein L21 [Acidobacteria bacterium]|nr:50S ribosomal protein L21 [Acidobacteriota bacterium]
MFAIIRSGGKQYKAAEGQVVRVEQLDVPVGEHVTIDDVLLLDTDDAVLVGTPTIQNAAVQATVMEHGQADKVIVFKKKIRKQYKRFNGHRQPFTDLKIDKISMKTE